MGWNQNHAFRGASTCELLLTAREHWTQHDSRGRPIQPGSHQTKHGDVIVCATTGCLRARLRTAPIRSRERQRAVAGSSLKFVRLERGHGIALLPDDRSEEHTSELQSPMSL